MPIEPKEITSEISLTLPNGKLNHDAVGWARQPLVITDGIGRDGKRFWGRNKRWEYWAVTTPSHLIALTVSSIDYAAVPEVWVFDRVTKQHWGQIAVNIPARGATMPGMLEHGPSRAHAKNLDIAIDEVSGGTRLRAKTPKVSFDIIAELPAGHERLAVVVPWSDTRFQYTVKDVGRPAHGTLTIEGQTYAVPPGESWATLDHGRGRWPYNMRWNWGAGAGVSNGREIGVQMGGKWTQGTGVTENAVFIDGKMYYLPEELTWDYDLENWRTPWRISGCGLDATFTPFYDKVTRTNLAILSNSTDQCFGTWSGTYLTPDGENIKFDNLTGWAEDVHNRW